MPHTHSPEKFRLIEKLPSIRAQYALLHGGASSSHTQNTEQCLLWPVAYGSWRDRDNYFSCVRRVAYAHKAVCYIIVQGWMHPQVAYESIGACATNQPMIARQGITHHPCVCLRRLLLARAPLISWACDICWQANAARAAAANWVNDHRTHVYPITRLFVSLFFCL